MIYTDKIPIDKATYEKHMREFADSLDERIDFLEKKLDTVDETRRALYLENLKKMKDKKGKLENKLKSLSNTDEKKWKKVYSDVEDKIEDNIREIENTYMNISDHFVHLFDDVNKQD